MVYLILKAYNAVCVISFSFYPICYSICTFSLFTFCIVTLQTSTINKPQGLFFSIFVVIPRATLLPRFPVQLRETPGM
jgi:hypothetical protein